MDRQSRFRVLRSQSTMPTTYSSEEEESESQTHISYSVRSRREMLRRRMSEFSADEKIDSPSNGDMTLVEPPRKHSGPLGRITSPQAGFAGGTPPTGPVSSTRTSVSRRSQMTSSELNHKHSNSISEREMKTNFSEVKSAMSEMKATFESSSGTNMSAVTTPAPAGSAMAKLANSGLLNRGGAENYDVIPSLDGDPVSPLNGPGKNIKFQQMTSSTSQTKIMTNSGYSSEEAIANSSQKKTFQADGVRYEEKSAEAAMKARIEIDGVKAEKAAAMKQEQKSLHTGEVAAQEINSSSSASMRVKSDNYSAEKIATTSQNERNMVTSTGSYNQQSRKTASTEKKLMINVKSIKTEISTASSSQMNGSFFDDSLALPCLDDLEKLGSNSNPNEIENAILKYTGVMSACVEQLKQVQQEQMPKVLNHVHEMIRKAWEVPTFGHDLGDSLCNVLRNNGGLDILLEHCTSTKDDLKLSSAKLLEQCLTQENRGYVVENALQKVVQVACNYTKEGQNPDHSRVGTGILEHLFKHNEITCTDVVKLGGLDAVIRECRQTDIETLRHCAGALANLSLYGGTENQEYMIKRKVPFWLFPLAFHNDDNIKYYACLAIAVLVANKEIEGQVRNAEALSLVEPFVSNHDPIMFANSCATHRHGQNKSWLQRLVPVLTSEKEEARNLAAFHFCMEAGIKKNQGQEDIFREIGAIEPLKRVASSPSPIASKYAAQTLRVIGEEVPHKLTPQVPLWSVEDVREWVKQVGFSEYCENFEKCQVDGDLLLQITDDILKDDIGIRKLILRKKFLRELNAMKQKADYSSCDKTKLNEFLQSIENTFSIYTYNLIAAGVSKSNLRGLTDDQLKEECGITNSIHRVKFLEVLCEDENESFAPDDKPLDVFISYRRSNGSQLASLLKVHLQLRGLSVFIDVDRLEAGKFDNNLLNSIRKAKHFILVLTPGALDRCIHDGEGKDWVHREIVEAVQSGCNIIPVMDNFMMPEAEKLPEDMRSVVHFNGVTWIHEYQDACVEKIDKFIRGERDGSMMGRYDPHGGMSTPSTSLTCLSTQTSVMGKPSYNRTASTDSGKAAACPSDMIIANGQPRE